MNLLLKWKIVRIELSLKSLIKKKGIKPMVWSFGAYYIDPKNMIFVVGVPSDQEKKLLKKNKNFTTSMNNLLIKHNWPEQARTHVMFDIESQETVDRETEGHWWYHYK